MRICVLLVVSYTTKMRIKLKMEAIILTYQEFTYLYNAMQLKRLCAGWYIYCNNEYTLSSLSWVGNSPFHRFYTAH